LTKKETTFETSLEKRTTECIQIIKSEAHNSTYTNYSDFTREFLVTTDASDFAIGAVLSQDPVSQDCPIAYASRILNKAEQNYNTTEKEFLAII